MGLAGDGAALTSTVRQHRLYLPDSGARVLVFKTPISEAFHEVQDNWSD